MNITVIQAMAIKGCGRGSVKVTYDTTDAPDTSLSVANSWQIQVKEEIKGYVEQRLGHYL